MSNRTRQNNKGADRKIESNHSPEIPDRGETSEEPQNTKRYTSIYLLVHNTKQFVTLLKITFKTCQRPGPEY